ncbi:MAG TPA: DUF2304 domain-containing protein [Microbacteriaceae bacterium]|nr:DUF2304 domain-containing protein [Microbacteriaceae bacterium]
MSLVTYLIGPILACILLALIVMALLRKRLRERHAGWWLIGGFVALVVSLFPQILVAVSSALGIVVPLNLVFLFATAVVFLVSLQHSAELTKLEERVRTLAEQVTRHEMLVQDGRMAPPAPPVEPGRDTD